MHARTKWRGRRSTAGIAVGEVAAVRLTPAGAVDLTCIGHEEKEGVPHAVFRLCDGVVVIPRPDLVGFWQRTPVSEATPLSEATP